MRIFKCSSDAQEGEKKKSRDINNQEEQSRKTKRQIKRWHTNHSIKCKRPKQTQLKDQDWHSRFLGFFERLNSSAVNKKLTSKKGKFFKKIDKDKSCKHDLSCKKIDHANREKKGGSVHIKYSRFQRKGNYQRQRETFHNDQGVLYAKNTEQSHARSRQGNGKIHEVQTRTTTERDKTTTRVEDVKNPLNNW